MLGVGSSHDLGVVVDHQEVGVVGQPADGKYSGHNSKHLHNLQIVKNLFYKTYSNKGEINSLLIS